MMFKHVVIMQLYRWSEVFLVSCLCACCATVGAFGNTSICTIVYFDNNMGSMYNHNNNIILSSYSVYILVSL